MINKVEGVHNKPSTKAGLRHSPAPPLSSALPRFEVQKKTVSPIRKIPTTAAITMMKVSVSNPRILAGAEVEVEGEPVEMGYAASLARAETLDKELAIPYSTEVWGWDKINLIK